MTAHLTSGRIPNSYLRLFFRYLGKDHRLLEGTELTTKLLDKLGGSHSFKDYCRFYENAARITGDASIGLTLSSTKQLSTAHGAMGAAIYNSPTVYDALKTLIRFMPLRISNASVKWLEDEHSIGLSLKINEDTYGMGPTVYELALVSLMNLVAEVGKKGISPLRVELDYPAPSYSQLYYKVFRQADVLFNQPEVLVMYSKEEVMQQADDYADPALRSSAVRRCEEMLRGINLDKSYKAQIRQLFGDNPGHLWTLAEIAESLNISARTLQRRLQSENTSYQQLQTRWLQQQSKLLLLEPRLTIENIALLLGYTDVSTFRQSCNRWFGKSPIALRSELIE